jgi:hypothetical protein
MDSDPIPVLSETRIRDLAGIITRDFRGIKNVNFATLLLSSEAEADREQARADIGEADLDRLIKPSSTSVHKSFVNG